MRPRLRRAVRSVLPSARLRGDLGNIARYGWHAPFRFQRVWFDPQACTMRTRDHVFRSYTWSGRVIGGDWDLDTYPVEDHPVFRFCRLHWEQGVPWEETGVYDWLLARIDERGRRVDGCLTRDDVVARYAELDRVFEDVRARGRLHTRRELTGGNDRERDGIRICIGRAGEPIFNWSGHHRLAMARILRLRRVPGQLQVVHPDALPTWRRRYGVCSRFPPAAAAAAPRARPGRA